MDPNYKQLIHILMDMEGSRPSVKCVYSFDQVWPSTALGFGGFGGSAMTKARTTVIQTDDDKYYIYFEDHIAYCVENPTPKFWEDLKSLNMADCRTAKTIY